MLNPRKHIPDTRCIQKRAEDPVIVCLGGGTDAGLADSPEAVHCDLMLRVDTTKPIENGNAAPHVGTVTICAKDSVLTLSRHSSILNNLVDSGGNFAVADGLQCLATTSFIAGEVESHQILKRQSNRTVRDAVFKGRGGHLDRLTTYELLGIGGTSGIAAPKVSATYLNSFWSAATIIWWVRKRIGSACHSGVRRDNLLDLSQVAILVRDIAWLRTVEHTHTTKVALFTEYPPCGVDDALRKLYSGLFCQALLSSGVRRRQQEVVCNGNNNDLGRIKIVQIGYGEFIEARSVTGQVAADYSRILSKLRTTPTAAPAAISGIRTSSKKKRNDKAVDFAELLELVRNSRSPMKAIAALASRSPITYRVSGEIRLRKQTDFELVDIKSHLNSFGEDFESYRRKVEVVAALIPHVEADLKTAIRKKKVAKAVLKRRILILGLVLLWVFAKGPSGFLLVAKLISGGLPVKLKEQMLLQAFRKLRLAASDFARATAMAVFLSVMRRFLLAEQHRLTTQLDSATTIMKSLKKYAPKMREVTPPPLNDVWSIVTQLRPSEVESNSRTLARFAHSVTATGLQKILKARGADHASLADAILNGEPATWAPHYGGDNSRTYGETYVVLPPLSDPELAKDIIDNLERVQIANNGVNVPRQVFFADSLAAGVNAVTMRICTPASIEANGMLDIFTPDLQEHFKQTILPNRWRDFYPEGLADAKWVADQLHIPFPKELETFVARQKVFTYQPWNRTRVLDAETNGTHDTSLNGDNESSAS